MTLSLCMIVKNEAQAITACLQTVTDLVDEIVVVDTGSTDDTVDLARRQGAQVIPFTWGEDFAAARNVGLQAATGDWIIVLDADERLTAQGSAQIRAIAQGYPAGDTLLGVILRRQEIGAQQAPYTLLTRLFRNRPDIRFQRPYHETIDDSLSAIQAQEPGWQISTLSGITIEHTGYQAETIARADKYQRARTIMERHLAQQPQDSYILNKLGALHVQRGDSRQGLPLLQRGLESCPPADAATRYELHYHLGLAHRSLQQLAEAEQHYRAALDQPVEALVKLGSHINLGSLLRLTKRLAAAEEQFQRAIAIDPSCAIAYFNLGVVYRAQQNLQAAAAAYRQAIMYRPTYGEAHQNLGLVLYKLGQFEDCILALQKAVAIFQTTNPDTADKLRTGIQALGLPNTLLAKAHLL
ncbi:glycosyl transferase [filamentous cyanobacterium CCP5]|nr:glycosyl transferase [filamentous cyanobacterium CCP5]